MDEGRFRELVDELPVVVWVASPDGKVEWSNALGERLGSASPEGMAEDELLGFLRIHIDQRDAVLAHVRRAISVGEPWETEFRSLNLDGSYRWVVARGSPIRDGAGNVLRWVAIATDVDELRRSLTILQKLVSEVPLGLAFVDRDLRVIQINKTGAALIGATEGDLISRRLPEVVPELWGLIEPAYRHVLESGETLTNLEYQAEAPGLPGDRRFWLLSLYPVRIGEEVIGVGGGTVDVTEQKVAELNLRHLAEHDSLTGIYNRWHLIDELDRLLRYARRSGRPGAVLVFDVDHLKIANDTYGHATGDAMLKTIADVLMLRARDTDVVARLGGDEFAVVLPEATEEEALVLARDVRALLRDRRTAPPVSTSVGVALFSGEDEITADEILICADTALYEAKEHGGDQPRVYRGQPSGTLRWVKRIREALAEERFVLYGQPIIDLHTGQIARRELLVRLVADGEVLAPATFIPTAERFGLIRELDHWVTAAGLRLARAGERVAINLSGYSIGEEPIIALVQHAIDEGMDPDNVTFEITETAALTNIPAARSFATTLDELGCAVALDDFGTGFGSFSHLKHIPARYLKIDIEFVRDLAADKTNQEVVKAIVGIAHSLDKQAVAEGVEDEDTVRLLRTYGVDYAQGFHLGRPGPLS